MFRVKVYEGTTYRGFRLFATLIQVEEYLDYVCANVSAFTYEVKSIMPGPRILNSPSLQKMFPDRYQLALQCKCTECGNKINPSTFRTEKDVKEFGLSGMCQKCIDRIYGEEE